MCVVRDANMGHQLAGGNSSWCPELESRTTPCRIRMCLARDDSTVTLQGVPPASPTNKQTHP